MIPALLFVAIAIGSAACWLQLGRWYALRDRYATPYFAFEKLPGQWQAPELRGTLAIFLLLGALYTAGLLVTSRLRHLTRATAVAAALAIALPLLLALRIYPVGALDVFNYLVDLKLAVHYHENPWLVTNPKWLLEDPITRSAFMLDAPLFYGPGWLLTSAIPGLLTGYGDPVRAVIGLKALNLLLLAGIGVVTWRAQPDRQRAWLATWAFLANPLVVFEGVVNAHNDVLMTALLLLAVVAATSWRRGWLALPLLALSALVKLFTVVLGPLFLLAGLRGRWGWRGFLAGTAAALVLAIALVAPFWDGGEMLAGWREGISRSQEMDHVSPYSLAQQWEKERQLAPLPRWQQDRMRALPTAQVLGSRSREELLALFGGIFALGAGLVAWRFWRGRIPLDRAAALTLALFTLCLTNLYGWYLLPIFALLALRPDRNALRYLVVGGMLALCYYPAYVWVHFASGWIKFDRHLLLACFLTVPMLLFLLLEAWREMRGGPREPS